MRLLLNSAAIFAGFGFVVGVAMFVDLLGLLLA